MPHYPSMVLICRSTVKGFCYDTCHMELAMYANYLPESTLKHRNGLLECSELTTELYK